MVACSRDLEPCLAARTPARTLDRGIRPRPTIPDSNGAPVPSHHEWWWEERPKPRLEPPPAPPPPPPPPPPRGVLTSARFALVKRVTLTWTFTTRWMPAIAALIPPTAAVA